MNKIEIRNIMKTRRLNLSEEERFNKSKIICDKFYSKYYEKSVFLMYYPVNYEVDTELLIERLYNEGKSVYLPCVIDKVMVFKLYEGRSKLVKGKFGVYEPAGKVLDTAGDVICMPGVAFDEECNRIGYGGGFYDRYLSKDNIIRRVALAYEFQIIDFIETESFDEPVNEIFTECRNILRG